MKENLETEYVKRTQRDYSYAFKMQVVQEVERGQLGLNAAQRKYGIQGNATTDSHHRFRKHKNLIETLIIDKPEQVWVSDITYIGTRSNPMYLSMVTDAYSKKIMGFSVSKSLHASGVIAAMKLAIKNRKYAQQQLIHHSDRGLQYCCDAYQELLAKYKIACSMTESYDPYQNAVAERINGILKHEFILGITTNDKKLMNKLIEQSIEIYNNQRPHWSCWMNTPSFMHGQKTIKIKTYKTKMALNTSQMPFNIISL